MSPGPDDDAVGDESFPRVSGDEPDIASTVVEEIRFSPRERG